MVLQGTFFAFAILLTLNSLVFVGSGSMSAVERMLDTGLDLNAPAPFKYSVN